MFLIHVKFTFEESFFINIFLLAKNVIKKLTEN